MYFNRGFGGGFLDNCRLEFVEKLKQKTDDVLFKLPWPAINPNYVSGLSILTSIFFVAANRQPPLPLFFLSLTLIFDLLDGVIARKHRLQSHEGHMVDVASDRISEAIIFSAYLTPWYYLFSLNVLLSIYSHQKNKHIILPLRQVFFVFYLVGFV
ncbi:MAG: hypothetical protein GF334_08310 [Candidatus Altiarchaeales archaeon]|nr:hypothetical protein [Candidatus Altiarchaeales archaeon]